VNLIQGVIVAVKGKCTTLHLFFRLEYNSFEERGCSMWINRVPYCDICTWPIIEGQKMASAGNQCFHDAPEDGDCFTKHREALLVQEKEQVAREIAVLEEVGC